MQDPATDAPQTMRSVSFAQQVQRDAQGAEAITFRGVDNDMRVISAQMEENARRNRLKRFDGLSGDVER